MYCSVPFIQAQASCCSGFLHTQVCLHMSELLLGDSPRLGWLSAFFLLVSKCSKHIWLNCLEFWKERPLISSITVLTHHRRVKCIYNYIYILLLCCCVYKPERVVARGFSTLRYVCTWVSCCSEILHAWVFALKGCRLHVECEPEALAPICCFAVAILSISFEEWM